MLRLGSRQPSVVEFCYSSIKVLSKPSYNETALEGVGRERLSNEHEVWEPENTKLSKHIQDISKINTKCQAVAGPARPKPGGARYLGYIWIYLDIFGYMIGNFFQICLVCVWYILDKFKRDARDPQKARVFLLMLSHCTNTSTIAT